MNNRHCSAVDHMRGCVKSQDHTGFHMDSNGNQWEDGPLLEVLGGQLQEESLIFVKHKVRESRSRPKGACH